MKRTYLLLVTSSFLIISCGGDAKKESVEETAIEEKKTEEVAEEEAAGEESTTDYSAGEEVYKTTCLACHQANGEGLPGAFPPLAGADYLLEDKGRAIEQVLNGSEGEIVVNGKTYNGVMPPQAISDEQVKDVLNYVLNSWGNEGGEISLEEVKNAKHPE